MNFNRKNLLTIIIVTLLGLFSGSLKVDAACSYEEKAKLNDLASLVKTNYDIIEETEIVDFIDPDTQEAGTHERVKTSFKISLYNLNKDIYVTEKNHLTKETKNIFYQNVNEGIYTFITDNIDDIIKYEYNIHSNLENCSGDVLKSYSFIKPKQNMYSQYRMCQGLEDVSYCKKFITEEIDVSESELEERLVKYLNSDENKSEDNVIKKNNYIYVIIGVGILVGTFGTIYFVKRRSAL